MGFHSKRPPIQAKKRQHGDETGALVSVDEGMVADDVKQVRCRHLGHRCVEQSVTECRGRCCQCGFEEVEVTNASTASVSVDLIRVKRENFDQCEERDTHYSARRLKTPAYCRCASATITLIRAVRPRRRTGATMMTSPSVEISSGVSAPIRARSSSALSNTRARLLPVRTSFLIMPPSVRTAYRAGTDAVKA